MANYNRTLGFGSFPTRGENIEDRSQTEEETRNEIRGTREDSRENTEEIGYRTFIREERTETR